MHGEKGPARPGARPKSKKYNLGRGLLRVSVASDISVLARLSGSQIDRLAAVFRSAESASAEKAREIAGGNFTDVDIDRIVRSFHVFLGMKEADMRRLAGFSSLGAGKMSIVRSAIDTMRYVSGAERIESDAANEESTAAPCRIERPLHGGQRSDPDSESRDLLALFGPEPEETPPPSIRGMLAGYTGDMDSLASIREVRDG